MQKKRVSTPSINKPQTRPQISNLWTKVLNLKDASFHFDRTGGGVWPLEDEWFGGGVCEQEDDDRSGVWKEACQLIKSEWVTFGVSGVKTFAKVAIDSTLLNPIAKKYLHSLLDAYLKMPDQKLTTKVEEIIKRMDDNAGNTEAFKKLSTTATQLIFCHLLRDGRIEGPILQELKEMMESEESAVSTPIHKKLMEIQAAIQDDVEHGRNTEKNRRTQESYIRFGTRAHALAISIGEIAGIRPQSLEIMNRSGQEILNGWKIIGELNALPKNSAGLLVATIDVLSSYTSLISVGLNLFSLLIKQPQDNGLEKYLNYISSQVKEISSKIDRLEEIVGKAYFEIVGNQARMMESLHRIHGRTLDIGFQIDRHTYEGSRDELNGLIKKAELVQEGASGDTGLLLTELLVWGSAHSRRRGLVGLIADCDPRVISRALLSQPPEFLIGWLLQEAQGDGLQIRHPIASTSNPRFWADAVNAYINVRITFPKFYSGVDAKQEERRIFRHFIEPGICIRNTIKQLQNSNGLMEHWVAKYKTKAAKLVDVVRTKADIGEIKKAADQLQPIVNRLQALAYLTLHPLFESRIVVLDQFFNPKMGSSCRIGGSDEVFNSINGTPVGDRETAASSWVQTQNVNIDKLLGDFGKLMEFYKQPEAATISYVDDTLYKLDQFSKWLGGPGVKISHPRLLIPPREELVILSQSMIKPLVPCESFKINLTQFEDSVSKNGSPLALGEATVGPWLLITKQTRDPEPVKFKYKDEMSCDGNRPNTGTYSGIRRFYFISRKEKEQTKDESYLTRSASFELKIGNCEINLNRSIGKEVGPWGKNTLVNWKPRAAANWGQNVLALVIETAPMTETWEYEDPVKNKVRYTDTLPVCYKLLVCNLEEPDSPVVIEHSLDSSTPIRIDQFDCGFVIGYSNNTSQYLKLIESPLSGPWLESNRSLLSDQSVALQKLVEDKAFGKVNDVLAYNPSLFTAILSEGNMTRFIEAGQWDLVIKASEHGVPLSGADIQSIYNSGADLLPGFLESLSHKAIAQMRTWLKENQADITRFIKEERWDLVGDAISRGVPITDEHNQLMVDVARRAIRDKRYAEPKGVVSAVMAQGHEFLDWGAQKVGIRTKNEQDDLEIKQYIEMVKKDQLLSASSRTIPGGKSGFPFWLYVPIVSVGVLYLIFVVWTNEMSKP